MVGEKRSIFNLANGGLGFCVTGSSPQRTALVLSFSVVSKRAIKGRR